MVYSFSAERFDDQPFPGRPPHFRVVEGSFTKKIWPDGTARFGAPTALQWLSDVDTLADVITIRYLCVSQRMRALIEQFEPNVHEFYPVRIALQNGQIEGRYFLHVAQTLETVSAEHSTWTKSSGKLWKAPPGIDKRLIFDARAIGGAHLWVNDGLKTSISLLASDTLVAAAMAMGMTGLRTTHYEQTDADGHYEWTPIPSDRVYLVREETRLSKDGHVALKVTTHFIDGDPKAITMADGPYGSPITLDDAMVLGHSINPTNVPTRAFYWQKTKGIAPDIHGNHKTTLTVSERMKDLIERFEPKVHQFLPINYEDKNGTLIERRYILVICAILDANNPEGQHVWRNATRHGRDVYRFFVSHTLATAMEERGFPHISYQPIPIEN